MSHSIEPNPDHKPAHTAMLGQTHGWLDELLRKHPRSGDELHRSDVIATGLADEQDAGIFSTLIVERKGPETIVDIERTHYGDATDTRGSSERYILTETLNGKYVLRTSGVADSLFYNSLFNENAGSETVSEALRHDEERLEELHDASSAETERFIDLVETAYLGEEYSSLRRSADEFDWSEGELMDGYDDNKHDNRQDAIPVSSRKKLGKYFLRLFRRPR